MLQHSILAKFFKRFKKGKKDECWLWLGSIDPNGYGHLQVGQKTKRAHRVSFEYFRKTVIDDSMSIAHLCPNKSCINPNHLKLQSTPFGSQGASNSKARLTVKAVREIRKYPGSGKSLNVLAKEFGVTKQTIWCVVHKHTWKHVV